jgi:hypothetical protein
MDFPYEQYKTLAGALTVYYPAGEEAYAHQINQAAGKAIEQLSRLFGRAAPDLQLLVVAADDWDAVPHDDIEEVRAPYPYFTEVTSPPTIVVPAEIDATFGTIIQEKLAFVLYHELTLAFLEDDPRPWPEDYPLWADEWQIKYVSLWLSHTLDNQQGIISNDLREQYADVFEPELNGKTPITIRGFDWFEGTEPEVYLCFELLLEQFAADLLERYDINILLRFLERYRAGHKSLLNEDITAMLADALGPGGQEWLEHLAYF